MLNRMLNPQWMQYYNSRCSMLQRERERGSLVPACLDLTRTEFLAMFNRAQRLPPVLEGLTYVVPVDLTPEMLADWHPPYLPPFLETIQLLSKEEEKSNLDDYATAVATSEGTFHRILPHRLALDVNGKQYQSLYGNESLFLHVEQTSSIGKQIAKEIAQYCQFVRAKSLVLLVNNFRTDANALTNSATEVFEKMAKHGIRFDPRPFLRSTFDPTHTEGYAQRRRLTPAEVQTWLENTPGTSLAQLKTEPIDDPVSIHNGYEIDQVVECKNPEDGSLDYSIITAS